MKRDTDFRVGDLVRIRSWKDMENDFGLDVDGDIPCTFCFSSRMRFLCGAEFIITYITAMGGYHGLDEADGHNILISKDMLEKLHPPEVDESDELNSFLDGIKIK